ncbi:unnamed protein product [Amoebophrya sp. A120]|nr:unnamed protein product [Amoebophrya sp. A120]|eukprot:GSA120T00025276001.1
MIVGALPENTDVGRGEGAIVEDAHVGRRNFTTTHGVDCLALSGCSGEGDSSSLQNSSSQLNLSSEDLSSPLSTKVETGIQSAWTRSTAPFSTGSGKSSKLSDQASTVIAHRAGAAEVKGLANVGEDDDANNEEEQSIAALAEATKLLEINYNLRTVRVPESSSPSSSSAMPVAAGTTGGISTASVRNYGGPSSSTSGTAFFTSASPFQPASSASSRERGPATQTSSIHPVEKAAMGKNVQNTTTLVQQLGVVTTTTSKDESAYNSTPQEQNNTGLEQQMSTTPPSVKGHLASCSRGLATSSSTDDSTPPCAAGAEVVPAPPLATTLGAAANEMNLKHTILQLPIPVQHAATSFHSDSQDADSTLSKTDEDLAKTFGWIRGATDDTHDRKVPADDPARPSRAEREVALMLEFEKEIQFSNSTTRQLQTGSSCSTGAVVAGSGFAAVTSCRNGNGAASDGAASGSSGNGASNAIGSSVVTSAPTSSLLQPWKTPAQMTALVRNITPNTTDAASGSTTRQGTSKDSAASQNTPTRSATSSTWARVGKRVLQPLAIMTARGTSVGEAGGREIPKNQPRTTPGTAKISSTSAASSSASSPLQQQQPNHLHHLNSEEQNRAFMPSSSSGSSSQRTNTDDGFRNIIGRDHGGMIDARGATTNNPFPTTDSPQPGNSKRLLTRILPITRTPETTSTSSSPRVLNHINIAGGVSTTSTKNRARSFVNRLGPSNIRTASPRPMAKAAQTPRLGFSGESGGDPWLGA